MQKMLTKCFRPYTRFLRWAYFTSLADCNAPPPPGSNLNLDKYNYVDKTLLIAEIMSEHAPPFILAPAMRRTGKTTTIDTLAHMARGEIQKFEGMDVLTHPSAFEIGKENFSLIQLDFSGVAQTHATTQEVMESFVEYLETEASEQHALDISRTHSVGHPGKTMATWIKKLREKDGNNKIILLIDEYDDPITTFIPKDPQKAEEIARIFAPFYKVIKMKGRYFYKVFITGIGRFSSNSIFSGSNSYVPLLEDDPNFATLFGFTQKEIETAYGPYIEKKFGLPLEQVMSKLKLKYNGYKIHPQQKERMYNPWSVVRSFQFGAMKNYWFDSATSSSFVQLVGIHGMDALQGYAITSRDLFAPVSASQFNNHWKQMAFQAGYTTIREAAVSPNDEYGYDLILGPPNEEVRSSLKLEMYRFMVDHVPSSSLHEYGQKLQSLDFDGAAVSLNKVVRSLKRSSLPRNETQFCGYAIELLKSADGFDEVFSSAGSKLEGDPPGRPRAADGVLLFKYLNKMYLVVIEAKFQKSVEVALQQIDERDYVTRVRKDVFERCAVTVDDDCVIKMGINMDYSTPDDRPAVQIKAERWTPQPS